MTSQIGYIALTDPDWYQFLSSQSRIDEVNFWQPHGNRVFRALQPGDPFFFKLRAPQKAIAGFGFFQRYESLPAWLAWESFEEMNGAPEFESMLDRIIRLRGGNSEDERSGEFQIGCIMIAAPMFFSQDDWVSPPKDWAKTGIQVGKKYKLDSGEGNRVLRECFQRALNNVTNWNIEEGSQLTSEGTPRFGPEITVRPRLGQGTFSFAVREVVQLSFCKSLPAILPLRVS